MKKLLACVACLVLVVPTWADDKSPMDVYKDSVPSVAFVLGGKIDSRSVAAGTAFVVDADKRLLVTCYHIVRDAKTVTMIFPERDKNGRLVANRSEALAVSKRYSATVLAVDPTRDLALIQADALPASARSLPMAAYEPEPGEELDLIGCPGASQALWTYSHGRVRAAAYQRQWTSGGDGLTLDLKARVVESTVLGNGGDSGGPVFNSRGELVGMHQGRNTTALALATAISVEEIRSFVKDQTPKPGAKPATKPATKPAETAPAGPVRKS